MYLTLLIYNCRKGFLDMKKKGVKPNNRKEFAKRNSVSIEEYDEYIVIVSNLPKDKLPEFLERLFKDSAGKPVFYGDTPQKL